MKCKKKKSFRRSDPIAYMMLTCQNFKPRFTASKKEAMEKRKKKITVKNYMDYWISYC